MALPQRADVVALRARRSPARAAVAAMRPLQWSKNLLVFAGIVFAAEIADAGRWVAAVTCFAAFCAASSAAYLVNDVRDARDDRLHPIKRTRPIARGELGRRPALGLAVGLLAAATGFAVAGGVDVLALLGVFCALQLAYSFGLKRLVLVDVMAIAGLFVLRAVAGAAAVDVRISPWLLLCTALLALFLALTKRRGELVLVRSDEAGGRSVLAGYSLPLVDQLVTVVASATLIAYSLYTFTAHSQAMMVTIPFVLFGIFRYLLLVHRHGLGEEPEQVLVTDVPILVTVALWGATSAAILVLT